MFSKIKKYAKGLTSLMGDLNNSDTDWATLQVGSANSAIFIYKITYLFLT